ncbi:hypothetical protein N7468_005430 [Penicillium chermesinum]|uniref:DUF3824 domain-containing protein n=1 Tax=Penicillium chermesinum TaxID=63820 RepID=A0A9W9NZ11_9EURO|nr:uncharacterized protein N7468_005430 [Penicillium chermesinum]KAJ5232474.1 hypothetical protein N7468_005430 [Penicillium chermesinum]KAJ6172131.1 hypothetical protein N7470_001198 [Penicillium chermesinum]
MANRDYYGSFPPGHDSYGRGRYGDYPPPYESRSRDSSYSKRDRPDYNGDLVPVRRSYESDHGPRHGHRDDGHSRRHSRHHGHHKDHEHRSHSRKHDHHETAQGAILGMGAAELVHHHRKKKGDDVSHGVGHVARTVGAGVLGAVALRELSDHRRDH